MQPSPPPLVSPQPVVNPAEIARRRQVDRTGMGIGILILYVLIAWVPPAEALGELIGAVGAILILLGSEAFGSRHTALVWLSVILYIGALVAVFAAVGSFAASVGSLPANASGPAAEAQVLSAFDTLIAGALAALAVICVAEALIVFELEDRPGRMLLVAAVVVQIVYSVLLFGLILDPLIHQAIVQAFASGTLDSAPIVAADQKIQGLSVYTLGNAVPALMFAAGYYWAYRRVRRGLASRLPPSAPAS